MKIKNTLIAVILLFGSSFLFGACSGGSTGTGTSSGGAFSSGLQKSQIIKTISSAQHEDLCRSFNKFLNDALPPEGLCTLAGIIAGSFIAQLEETDPIVACNNTKSECLDNLDPSEFSGDCIVSEPEKLQSCDATVTELESCLNDVADQLNMFFDTLVCEQVLDPSFPQSAEIIQGQAPSTPACNALQTKCPQIFEHTESN